MRNVRRMKPEELPQTLELIHSVFTEFEAPDYSDDGVNTFYEFIEEPNIQQGIDSGELCFWVCYVNGEITGTIAMKNRTHICMLFVGKRYHRKGIATELLHPALEQVDKDEHITVNSSPYGITFYRTVGFADTDELTTRDGIKYLPMKAKCSKLKK